MNPPRRAKTDDELTGQEGGVRMDPAIRSASLMGWLRAAWDAGFTGAWSPRWRWIAWLWMGAHFLAGLWLWYYFLNGGSIQLDLHDWAEAAKRLAILKDAVINLKVPLHAPGTSALKGVTDRFLSVPEIGLSPQVFLLRTMGIGQFVLVNTLILYTLGFLGLVGLRRRLRLSLVSFSFLFWLLVFNGHIVDHIAVGHVNWSAYLLTPVLVLAFIRVLDDPQKWTPALVASGLMCFVFLQGAFHLFALAILFAALMPLFDWSLWRGALRLGAFSLLLSMARILPAAIDAGKFDTAYLSGFPTTQDVVAALVTLRPPVASEVLSVSPLTPLGWWEFDYYIGVLATGLVIWYCARSFPGLFRVSGRARALACSTVAFIVLSVGSTYKILHLMQIPMLASQRVGSRLLFIPFVVFVTMAVVGLQAAFDKDRGDYLRRVVMLGSLVVVANDLWQHLKLWRVTNMGGLFPPVPLDLDRFFVKNHPDPVYVLVLVVGLVVAVATSGVAVVLVSRERREARPLQDELGASRNRSRL